jgi:hypothetical protein
VSSQRRTEIRRRAPGLRRRASLGPHLLASSIMVAVGLARYGPFALWSGHFDQGTVAARRLLLDFSVVANGVATVRLRKMIGGSEYQTGPC